MASTSDAQSNTSQAPEPAPSHPPRTRGRGGHGAGRGAQSSRNNSGQSDRGRGRGRGRSGRGRGQTRESDIAEEHRRQLRAQLIQGNGESNGKIILPTGGDETVEGDADVCFICASPVVHNAVSPCNHRTCHICALRLRALYKTKACAHCRTNADFVIFTDTKDKRFEEFIKSDFSNTDDNLGIQYEKPEIFEDTVLLLRYNCPDESCDVACLGWPDLHRHVKNVHHKVMCDLCTRNKKVFTHEHELFTSNGLRKHERFGDDHPGTEDQTGFRGHPECGFCRQRFYGDDELYTHCREKHERCHICDRRDGGQSHQYYVDYDSLEMHFRKDHFLCPDRECLEKKFVVFEDKTDLNAHQLEEHPNVLTKEARRDAQRVDMTGFSLREQYNPRDGSRAGRGRGSGRGRHPDSEPLPQSTAQPMRRDELAYQRQMAIQSAQSASNRTFGGQLTPAEAYAARPPAQASNPPTVTATRSNAAQTNDYLSLESLNVSDSQPPSNTQPAANLSPAERTRQLRHQHVTERASTLLHRDAVKERQFRERISSFKNSKITATELIDAFFTLFDAPSADLGKLVKELAEIFEVGSKKEDLLKAWADWKAINEDYPSLPGPSGAPAGSPKNPSAIGGGGMRVLKLKSSTAQSGRSGLGRQGSWGTAAATNGGSGGDLNFPSLGGAITSGSSGGRSRPAWWSNAAGSSGAPSASADSKLSVSSRASPAPPANPPRSATSKMNSSEAFPALPTAAKPTSSYFSPGYAGSAVRRDVVGWAGANRAPASNAWGTAASAAQTANDGEAEDASQAQGGKKKGKQGKKQVLMQFG